MTDLFSTGYYPPPLPPRKKKKSTRDSDVGCALGIFVLLTLIPLMIIDGMIGAKLWEWYAVDQFGAVSISAAQAMGLGVLVRFFTYQAPESVHDDYKKPPVNRLIAAYATPFFFLFMGWLYLQFV